MEQGNSIGIVKTQFVTFKDEFFLESGRILSPVTLAYETYGTLNENKDNVILVCHALTGSAHAAGLSSPDDTTAGWWDAMIGPGKTIDTDKYFVICSNILGSCYGSTGPASVDPYTGNRYALKFPVVTIRDMVKAQKKLLNHLKIEKLFCVIGGSMGGMQSLEWAITFPEMVENVKVDENGFERTNFRTLTEFFRCLERYPNRELTNDERYMLQIDGKSLLDSETVASFMSFMEMDMKLVIEPERILKDSNPCIKEVYDLMKGKEPRIDIVSVTCNRLLAYLSSDSYEFKQEHVKNFQNFMTCDHENPGLGIPKDISQSIMRQLIRNKNKKYLVEFIRNNNIIREWGTEALKNTRIINSF